MYKLGIIECLVQAGLWPGLWENSQALRRTGPLKDDCDVQTLDHRMPSSSWTLAWTVGKLALQALCRTGPCGPRPAQGPLAGIALRAPCQVTVLQSECDENHLRLSCCFHAVIT
jgi:hypothetical protein